MCLADEVRFRLAEGSVAALPLVPCYSNPQVA
jgi:hypothetical protein